MRTAIAALLLLAATSAWAEWVKIAETTEATFYVDPATIGKDGNLRRVVELQDFARPESNGARSRRVLAEFNCMEQQRRRLSVTEHSEPMAGGKTLASWDGVSEWSSLATRTGTNIPPRTPQAMILRFVCSR